MYTYEIVWSVLPWAYDLRHCLLIYTCISSLKLSVMKWPRYLTSTDISKAAPFKTKLWNTVFLLCFDRIIITVLLVALYFIWNSIPYSEHILSSICNPPLWRVNIIRSLAYIRWFNNIRSSHITIVIVYLLDLSKLSVVMSIK